ncbi:hypothetical protein D3C72_1078070 [compost metagenome]
MVHGQVGQEVPRADLARHLPARADRAEAAAVHARHVRRLGVQGGRGGEVDRAAQRGAAIGEAVAALVDLRRRQANRIDLIEVAAAIGEVGRYAVLEDVDAARVEAARHARAAHRQAQFLAVAFLDVDAGRILEHISQIAGVGVGIRRRVNEPHRASGFEQRPALLADARRGQRSRRRGRRGDGGQHMLGRRVGRAGGLAQRSRGQGGRGQDCRAAPGIGSFHDFLLEFSREDTGWPARAPCDTRTQLRAQGAVFPADFLI